MKKGSILFPAVTLILLLPLSASASQGKALYIEIMGPGIYSSLNYEFSIHKNWFLRLGGMWYTGEWGWTALAMANHLSGKGNHHFELGYGMTILGIDLNAFDNNYQFGDITLAVAMNIGYRFQSLKHPGLVFRIAATPIFTGRMLLPWIGMSLGYSWGH